MTTQESSLDNAPSASAILFQGDSGALSDATRRALIALLSGPAIDGRRQSRLWTTLLRDEAVLRSRLHDLFLDLVVDRDQQVAFTIQVVAEGGDFPRLLRQMPLTVLDSALLLHLRQLVTQADSMNERAVVSVSDLREHMRVYEPQGNTDRALYDKRFNAALEKIKKRSLLHKIRGADERYEVSPTLKLVFGAAQIEELTRAYRRLAQDGVIDPGALTPAPEDEDAIPESRDRDD